MKARINIVTSAQRKVIKQEIEKLYEEHAEAERNDMTRRILKTAVCVLNEQFGFGHDRAMKFISEFTKKLEESDRDIVFWEHIDRIVIDNLGLPFERDYTNNGQVISESMLEESKNA